MKGPEIYLNQLGIELECAVFPHRAASIDSLHRVFVNWETYFVSDTEALEMFEAEPHKYIGRVTDPVSMIRFEPTAESLRAEYEGRVYFFASAENAQQFARAPQDYATPMIAMRRMME